MTKPELVGLFDRYVSWLHSAQQLDELSGQNLPPDLEGSSRADFGRDFDEPIALPNGRDPPMA
jgi:hypothetical protein